MRIALNSQAGVDGVDRDHFHPRSVLHAGRASSSIPARRPSKSTADCALDARCGGRINRISFVVPAYNEAGGIADLIHEIAAAGCALGIEFEIVVVNDGSGDATATVLEQLCAAQPALTVIHQHQNRGQSAALHRGIQAAGSDWVVTLDGDGQNVPADAARLIARLEQCDHFDNIGMVVGRRRVRHDRLIKRISSRIANGVRRRLLGDGVSDTGCGLKLIRRDLFLEFPGFDHMHRFLPALARMHAREVIEVDVGHRPRSSGSSKYGTLDRLAAGLVDVLGVLWLKKRALARNTNPEVGR